MLFRLMAGVESAGIVFVWLGGSILCSQGSEGAFIDFAPRLAPRTAQLEMPWGRMLYLVNRYRAGPGSTVISLGVGPLYSPHGVLPGGTKKRATAKFSFGNFNRHFGTQWQDRSALPVEPYWSHLKDGNCMQVDASFGQRMH